MGHPLIIYIWLRLFWSTFSESFKCVYRIRLLDVSGLLRSIMSHSQRKVRIESEPGEGSGVQWDTLSVTGQHLSSPGESQRLKDKCRTETHILYSAKLIWTRTSKSKGGWVLPPPTYPSWDLVSNCVKLCQTMSNWAKLWQNAPMRIYCKNDECIL